MELFLDSVNFQEIEEAFDWGFFAGLTTTPTFMHRHGITNVDEAIVKLSKMVPELHVEAIGESYDEIMDEAHRIADLPLANAPVFKVPVSNIGFKACNKLRSEGFKVNVHLVYTLNQAYMAMSAGASYICPLVGRLHDQGHDSMALIQQSVEMVNHYGKDTKVMVSSVRHTDHVRQAILNKAHVCTAPWGVIKKLGENVLTSLGTTQFLEHTKLMSVRVREIIEQNNPVCTKSETVNDALIKMTESGFGAVSIVDDSNKLVGILTDGDLRRKLNEIGKAIVDYKLEEFADHLPTTIAADALLYEAVNIFTSTKFDNLVVVENDTPIGILDIQDLVKMGLIG